MSFFERPPDEPDEWGDEDDDDGSIGFPTESRWLGGVVPVESMVGRSDKAAVAVRRITAFDDGLELEVVAWLRRPTRGRRRGRFHQEIMLQMHGPFERDERGKWPDELVRIGVQFPDGAKVTNLAEHWMFSPDTTEPAHGMEPRGGLGSSGESSQTFWIWPLPPEGNLLVVCEWPAGGINESSVILDGDILRAAASRSTPVWPDEPSRTQVQAQMRARIAELRAQHGPPTGYRRGAARMIRRSGGQSSRGLIQPPPAEQPPDL